MLKRAPEGSGEGSKILKERLIVTFRQFFSSSQLGFLKRNHLVHLVCSVVLSLWMLIGVQLPAGFVSFFLNKAMMFWHVLLRPLQKTVRNIRAQFLFLLCL